MNVDIQNAVTFLRAAAANPNDPDNRSQANQMLIRALEAIGQELDRLGRLLDPQ